jgi:hypothetical protein
MMRITQPSDFKGQVLIKKKAVNAERNCLEYFDLHH